jgi:hypothetical protein
MVIGVSSNKHRFLNNTFLKSFGRKIGKKTKQKIQTPQTLPCSHSPVCKKKKKDIL